MNAGAESLATSGLLDVIPDGAWLKDLDGRYVSVNAAFAATLGRSKNDIVGRCDDDLFPSAVAALFRRRDERAIARPDPVVTEARIPIVDVERWFETIAQGVYDAHGTLIGTSGVARDITSRKGAESALRASEARLRAMFEESPLGIGLADPDGFIIDANSAYLRMVGYSRDELRRMRLRELSPDGRAEEDSELFESLMAGTRQSYVIEKVYRKRSGETLNVRLTASGVRDESGRVAYSVGMVEDITDNRKTEVALREKEEQLRQAQKMESIGRLAGGVAHDFNNLLTVIIAHAEFLRAGAAPWPDAHEDIDQIAEAAVRASKLTRQLLAFGRKQILQPRAVDLNEIVQNLVPILSRSLGEDVDVRMTLAEDLPAIHADPGQIEQVIMNLAANARDAMPRGGTLVFETRLATCRHDQSLYTSSEIVVPRVVLSVSDTGVGMEASVAARVFEPFFTTKEPGRGTGLGLSTVYGIIKQSGGTITLDTKPGQGATFSICLPIDPDEPARTDRRVAAASPPAHERETILLVEDEEAVRRLTTRILTRNGYDVIEASSGSEALRHASDSSATISLLLTDIVMPEMGGSELASAVRRVQPNVAVLYMSGYTDDEVFQRGLLLEGTSFLPKPFTGAALLDAVRKQLEAVTA